LLRRDAKLAKAVLNAATETVFRSQPRACPSYGDCSRTAPWQGCTKVRGRACRPGVAQRGDKTALRKAIDPAEGHFELGYVDLVTGDLHPAIEGGLNKNLGTGKGYLGRLAERDPARSGFAKSGAQ